MSSRVKWFPSFYTTEKYKGADSLTTDSQRNFIVHWHAPNQQRKFTVFENPLAFLKYFRSVPPEEASYFETIPGTVPQKLYFDVDISDEENLEEKAERTLQNLLETILEVFEDQIQLEQLLVFSSHSDCKKSFHIVINDYFVASNEYNRQFAEKVQRTMLPELSKYVDSKVYSTFQQFRLLGSRKLNSDRVKVFVDKFEYKGELYQNRRYRSLSDNPYDQKAMQSQLFLDSCVTNVLNCSPYRTSQVIQKKSPTVYEEVPVAESEIGKIKQTIQEQFPEFHFIKISANRVDLRRKHPSNCKVCKRVHEHENAFIIVSQIGQLRFYCRRNTSRYKEIGSVELLRIDEVKPENEKPKRNTHNVFGKITNLEKKPTEQLDTERVLKLLSR